MCRHVEAEQRHKPQYGHNGDWDEKELGVVEEGQFLVAQEGNDEVVVQRGEVERVRKEQREPSNVSACSDFLSSRLTNGVCL